MSQQPALIPTAAVKPPHPGSACCDLTQDLAGWIQQQRARIARDWRWFRAWRQRGTRLDRASVAAYVAQDDDTGRALRLAAITACGNANAWAQKALIREGDVDRIEAAHAWRLQPTLTEATHAA